MHTLTLFSAACCLQAGLLVLPHLAAAQPTARPNAGVVSTLAGGQLNGSADGDGIGRMARFNSPHSVAVDTYGRLFVSDRYGSTLRRCSPGGVVTTLAGTPNSEGAAIGLGAAARFTRPTGVAIGTDGTVYMADDKNNVIYKITQVGVVTTLAGELGGYSEGNRDGEGSAARFREPKGVAVDAAGTVYVADFGNHAIRKITPAGVVSTLAGAGPPMGRDGTGSGASFYNPAGIAVDAAGVVYVAEYGNHTIRRITPAGVVTTLAGAGRSPGDADGTGAAARFNHPQGIAVDAAGTVLYVADYSNHLIRRVEVATGRVTTLAGQTKTVGDTDGQGAAALFGGPTGVALDDAGVVYVVSNDGTLRVIK